MNESERFIFTSYLWHQFDVWQRSELLHLKPAEPPHHCTTSRGEIPTVCNKPESLVFTSWMWKKKKKLPCNPAMQVFTARSENIQRDPEQVVLNKFVLSCWVCLVDGTKIRCAGQFRPGFLSSVWQSKLIPRQRARNNEWLELDFAQRAPAWLTHSTMKSKCWQLGLISHNCCGLGTENRTNGNAKYRERQ